MASFNGLGMHMGNLAILSDAESRSISAENPTGEKGKGAMATPDPAKSPGAKAGPRMEGRAVRRDRAGRGESAGRYRGRGRDRANLDDADGAVALEHHEDLLGRIAGAVSGMPGRRFFRLRMEQVMRRSRRWRCA